MRYLFLLVAISIVSFAKAQKENVIIMEGNVLFRQQQFDAALNQYNDALKIQPNNAIAKFNLATATYRIGKEDEALKAFAELSKNETDNQVRSKSFYNIGAILSKQKKLEESIEAYKSALRLNPDDKEARENLQKSLLELKKKEPPKKEDQKKKKQQQKQPQSMSRQEAQQRLKLLEQKEKQVQERLQKEKSKTGGSQTKDW